LSYVDHQQREKPARLRRQQACGSWPLAAGVRSQSG
jgi:hypothetical protein